MTCQPETQTHTRGSKAEAAVVGVAASAFEAAAMERSSADSNAGKVDSTTALALAPTANDHARV